MTPSLVSLDAFLVTALAQRGRKGEGRRLVRSFSTAVEFATRCGARMVTGRYSFPSYSPSEDLIRIPTPTRRLLKRPKFLALQVLHELSHWTGVPARLNRPQAQERWDSIYNREELVAEISAVLLSYDLGITNRPILQNHDYLANFLGTIDRPDVAMHVALSLAQQAAAYLHAIASQPQHQTHPAGGAAEPRYGVASYL